MIDKQFQKADWRIRPFSQEQVAYARNDTRLLLPLLAKLLETLANQKTDPSLTPEDSFRSVLADSNKIASKVFKKPQVFGTAFDSLASNLSASDSLTRDAFVRLWRLRDQKARLYDESPNALAPSVGLLELAKQIGDFDQAIIEVPIKHSFEPRFVLDIQKLKSELTLLSSGAKVSEQKTYSSLSQGPITLEPFKDNSRMREINSFPIAMVALREQPKITFAVQKTEDIGYKAKTHSGLLSQISENILKTLEKATTLPSFPEKSKAKARNFDEEIDEEERDDQKILNFGELERPKAVESSEIEKAIRKLNINLETKRDFLAALSKDKEREKLKEMHKVFEPKPAESKNSRPNNMIDDMLDVDAPKNKHHGKANKNRR